MSNTIAELVTDLIYQVSVMDKVNMGVAKARLAGEAVMSVPSLERLQKGHVPSPSHQAGLLKAASARKLRFQKSVFTSRANEKKSAS